MTRCQTLADDLKEYVRLSQDEWGEKCGLLIQLAQYPSYCSDGFYAALESEVEIELYMIKEQCKIVEHVETIEQKYKTLERR